MKLKHLESLLEDVEPFREPNVQLEQYPTGAHLAACVIHTAHARGDIEDCKVVDLGKGGRGAVHSPLFFTLPHASPLSTLSRFQRISRSTSSVM